jgi:hypothetical protein
MKLVDVNPSQTMIQFHDIELNLITTRKDSLTLERSGKPDDHEYQVMYGGQWRCSVTKEMFVELNAVYGFATPAYPTCKEKD